MAGFGVRRRLEAEDAVGSAAVFRPSESLVIKSFSSRTSVRTDDIESSATADSGVLHSRTAMGDATEACVLCSNTPPPTSRFTCAEQVNELVGSC